MSNLTHNNYAPETLGPTANTKATLALITCLIMAAFLPFFIFAIVPFYTVSLSMVIGITVLGVLAPIIAWWKLRPANILELLFFAYAFGAGTGFASMGLL